nr:hypothetical protein [Candidatus Sigynarchaeota archaeon]
MTDVHGLKCKYSYIPDEILDDALQTLKNPRMRMEYYRFLVIFQEAFVALFSDDDRASMLKDHAEIQSKEKKHMACAVILKHHPNWGELFDIGVNLLSISRNDVKGANANARVGGKSRKGSSKSTDVRSSIGTYLSNQDLLLEYKVFLEYYKECFLKPEFKDTILSLQDEFVGKRLDAIDQSLFLKQESINALVEHWHEIFQKNGDWARFLPPNNENFYSILGLDKEKQNRGIGTNDDESVFRKMLLDKFKVLPKTIEVNQAYTVLRNPANRDEYNWMLDHHLEMQRM